MSDARGAEPSDRLAHEPPEEPPPILGRWSRLYTLVLTALAIEIAIFWAITRALR